MSGHPKSPLVRWRRMQLAKHLIETEGHGLDQFGFDACGGLVRMRADGRPPWKRWSARAWRS